MNIKLLFVSLLICLQQAQNSIDVGPILEPDPVKFTFETKGWLVLAIVFIISVLIVVFQYYKLYKKNLYRRNALKKLNVIQLENTENHFKINQLNILLKQVAISTYSREKAANLYGDEWLLFLETGSNNTKFTNYSRAFSKAIYEGENVPDIDYKNIVQLTKIWIKTHA